MLEEPPLDLIFSATILYVVSVAINKYGNLYHVMV